MFQVATLSVSSSLDEGILALAILERRTFRPLAISGETAPWFMAILPFPLGGTPQGSLRAVTASSVPAVLQNGNSIWVVADARHGRHDRPRAKIDHPYRAARGGGGSKTRPARDDRVAPVGSYRRALGISRALDTVRIHGPGHRNPGDLGTWIVRQREAQVDDRNVIRAIVRDNNLPSVWRPRDRERSRLAVGIVRPDANARGLGARHSQSGLVDVDDRDRVAF